MPKGSSRFGGGIGRTALARLYWLLLRLVQVDISYRGVLTGRYQHAGVRGRYSPSHTTSSDGIRREHAEFLYEGLEARRRETEAKTRELLAWVLGSAAYIIGLANTARIPLGYPWILILYFGPIALCFRTQSIRNFYEPRPQFLRDPSGVDERDSQWAADVHHCFLRNEAYYNTRVEFFRGARRLFFVSTVAVIVLILLGSPKPSAQAEQERLALQIRNGQTELPVRIGANSGEVEAALQIFRQELARLDSLSMALLGRDSTVMLLEERIRHLERKLK